MIFTTIFIGTLLCMLIPAIIVVPLMVKYDLSVKVPILLLLWVLTSWGLLQLYSHVLFTYYIDKTVVTENVCEQITKTDLSWK